MKKNNNENIYFSIHGIIGIMVDKSYLWTETLLNDLPQEYATDEDRFLASNTQLTIYYDKKAVEKNKKDHFFISNGAINDYRYGCKVVFRSKKRIDLFCNQECNEWMMFCISYLLNVNGYTFLHAACFKKDNECMLIFSGSGAGKTMITLDYIKNKDYTLLGDDLCISNGDIVYSYPKKMVLYPWHLGTQKTKKIYISNSLKEKMKSILRKFPKLLAFLRKNNPSLNTISPYAFFGPEKISEFGVATKMIYLERNEIDSEPSNEDMIIKSCLTINHELYKYFNDVLEFAFMNFGFLDSASFYFTTKEILTKLSNKNPFLYLNISKDIKGPEISDIVYNKLLDL